MKIKKENGKGCPLKNAYIGIRSVTSYIVKTLALYL